MTLPPVYSRRKRILDTASPDVFTYDAIPNNLKISLFMIMDRAADYYTSGSSYKIWDKVVDSLREELGVYKLAEINHHDPHDELQLYFNHLASIDRILDTIEFWNFFTVNWIRKNSIHRTSQNLTDSIAILNARLFENGIGFELVNGQIVEKANEFAHSEIVLPALRILSESRFSGANQEFREAHQAYRDGSYKDCLIDCLKSFESVIKTIAERKGWQLPPNPNAKILIASLFENELVPPYMQSQFDGLRTLLESSVPTTRNKVAGHGQGPEVIQVPKALATLQLHQTAAMIIFLSDLA